jgi:hypothetical protein
LSQSLADNYLPIRPFLEHDGLVFSQTLFVSGAKDANMAYALYRIENRRAQPPRAFFPDLPPFQVTPSWQGEAAPWIFSALNAAGRKRACRAGQRTGTVVLSHRARDGGAVTYQEGEIMDFIAAASCRLIPLSTTLGGASGALQYHYNLAAGAGTNYIFAAPLGPQANPASLTASAWKRTDPRTGGLAKQTEPDQARAAGPVPVRRSARQPGLYSYQRMVRVAARNAPL